MAVIGAVLHYMEGSLQAPPLTSVDGEKSGQ